MGTPPHGLSNPRIWPAAIRPSTPGMFRSMRIRSGHSQRADSTASRRAAYANGDADGVPAQAEELVTSYSVSDGAAWTNPDDGQPQTGRLGQMTSPDGTVYKEYAHSSSWDKGLARLAEVWSGGMRKKWTSTAWTQDDEALLSLLNPRVRETNVYDSNENGTLHSRRRTEVSYIFWGLPEDVKEYDTNGTTVLRR